MGQRLRFLTRRLVLSCDRASAPPACDAHILLPIRAVPKGRERICASLSAFRVPVYRSRRCGRAWSRPPEDQIEHRARRPAATAEQRGPRLSDEPARRLSTAYTPLIVMYGPPSPVRRDARVYPSETLPTTATLRQNSSLLPWPPWGYASEGLLHGVSAVAFTTSSTTIPRRRVLCSRSSPTGREVRLSVQQLAVHVLRDLNVRTAPPMHKQPMIGFLWRAG